MAVNYSIFEIMSNFMVKIWRNYKSVIYWSVKFYGIDLVSSFRGMDSTALIHTNNNIFSFLVKTNLVNLKTSHTSPNGECSIHYLGRAYWHDLIRSCSSNCRYDGDVLLTRVSTLVTRAEVQIIIWPCCYSNSHPLCQGSRLSHHRF